MNASLEDLVTEIVAINKGWKAAAKLLGEDSPLAVSMRDLKSCLQVRLLRWHPEEVFLERDEEAEGEPLFSLRLKSPVQGRRDAEHLPVRVAEALLSGEEILARAKTD